MNVVFLDYQGVMYLKDNINIGTLDTFDSECVDILNFILLSLDVEIVVSSDWKYWVDIEEMRSFYKNQGVIKLPIDYTPKMQTNDYPKCRFVEILTWLSHNDIDKWLSIDDLDMRLYIDNFIWIEDRKLGLKSKGVSDFIIKYFN